MSRLEDLIQRWRERADVSDSLANGHPNGSAALAHQHMALTRREDAAELEAVLREEAPRLSDAGCDGSAECMCQACSYQRTAERLASPPRGGDK